MSALRRRPILLAFAVLLLTAAVRVRADQPALAAGGAPIASATPALEDLLPATPAAVCTAGDTAAQVGVPEILPLQPHCCSQQEVDACRTNCKAQGPGCKGQIGCRAGECVCTCNCP